MPPLTPLERLLKFHHDEVVRIIQKDMDKVHKRLDQLDRPSKLPPIPIPSRGVDFVREPNVTALMRAAIEAQNAAIPDTQGKYVQFPIDSSDKKLNSDAKDALDALMLDVIGEEYGKLRWGSASRTTHIAECEKVVRLAAASKDFVVYAQSSNLWCIRWLAEQKMKSKGRHAPPKTIKPSKSPQLHVKQGSEHGKLSTEEPAARDVPLSKVDALDHGFIVDDVALAATSLPHATENTAKGVLRLANQSAHSSEENVIVTPRCARSDEEDSEYAKPVHDMTFQANETAYETAVKSAKTTRMLKGKKNTGIRGPKVVKEHMKPTRNATSLNLDVKSRMRNSFSYLLKKGEENGGDNTPLKKKKTISLNRW